MLKFLVKRYVYMPKWYFALVFVVATLKIVTEERVEWISLCVGLYLCFLGFRGRLLVLFFATFYFLMESDVLHVLSLSLVNDYHLQNDFLYFFNYNERILWIFTLIFLFYTFISELVYRKAELLKLMKKSRIGSPIFSVSFWLVTVSWFLVVLNLFSALSFLSSSAYYFATIFVTLIIAFTAYDPVKRNFSLLALTCVFGSFMLVHYVQDPFYKIIFRVILFFCGFVFQIYNGGISKDNYSIESNNIIDSWSNEESSLVNYSCSSEENSEILFKTFQNAFEYRKSHPNEAWEDIFKNFYKTTKQEMN